MMEDKKDEQGTTTESSGGAGDAVNILDADAVGVVPDAADPADGAESDSGEQPGAEPTDGEETFGSVDILSEPDDDDAAAAQDDAIAQSLRKQIEALTAELEERNAQYKRIAADFENFRRRTQREKAELEDKAKITTITDLLPVIDNFERARAQIKPQTDAEMTIHKSYQGVYKQLVDCLKRIGVSPMRSEGEVFDPNLHEAVMREPTDQYEEGVVMEDLMRGYMLGDRVLRHAMVKVAAAPEEPSASSESPEGGNESSSAG